MPEHNENQSNPKLFLFCIGGTGVRVLKALAFLMAAGVDIKASKIIPIVIDPDKDNGDVNRTMEILNKYRDIREGLSFEQNSFFRAEFQSLANLDKVGNEGRNVNLTMEGYRFGIDGSKEGRFREFIGYDHLEPANKAFVSTLFSENNLNLELKVGFKGSPHMGSIVLNKFSSSDDFAFFASRFNQNDRIFIVSSIFGGTGAAGFPLIVKNIRDPRRDLNNVEYLRKARIGAITVKPYFGVKSETGASIKSGAFITKTKAALQYYDKNITGNQSLNALYYIGDTQSTEYNFHEGESSQKNWAHLIEFLSALAVIDFMGMEDSRLKTGENGRAESPVYKEYGLNKDVTMVEFANLGSLTRERIYQPLVQFAYATYYWNQLKQFPAQQPWTNGFSSAFLQSDFFRDDLKPFVGRFEEWLSEMAKNERGFKPFKLDTGPEDLHLLIEGVHQAKKGKIFKKENWGIPEFDGYLNRVSPEIRATEKKSRFLSLFSSGTEQAFKDRIKL